MPLAFFLFYFFFCFQLFSPPTLFISNLRIVLFTTKLIVQNNLQWTINGRTIVEEVTGDSEIIVPAVYNFVLFSRLHTYIDSLSHVDVIGIAIEIKPKKEIITNDGLEIVQEMTLMNDKKPIIIGCRLKVSSYNGISLSTKSSSSFVIELEIPQAAALSIWYNANAEKAMDIICGRIGLETKSLSTLPSAEDIITIKMIDNQLNTRRSFWINGHIKVTNLIQPFWYLSCEKCTKATGYEFEQRFNCLYCRHDQVKAMPRCRVIVDLIDESSSLNATLFGNQAEKFLDSVKDIEKIATLSSSHKLLIQVKASKHEYHDITRWKYTILSICDTISKEINTLTQTDTSNDAEVSGLWYGMHYGYDDLQYGKDRVGVFYTKFWTSLLYFRKDFDLPCK
ncbi:hypothetical protein FEM48_Zijuj11G0143100 [Ziziphus jujuba var. spinosa]|uniref:Replication protein A 70 kDa DNA-binding subunit B-like n=1 Tax=Ziziphus jujuba var. spinosa TaxID=714518 RepID=A0A978UJF6_ZIZJJ|nr:hypothetical protein FEM48_Zijuj11G0143100 [Ziziphus jujuba var. spinosa]